MVSFYILAPRSGKISTEEHRHEQCTDQPEVSHLIGQVLELNLVGCEVQLNVSHAGHVEEPSSWAVLSCSLLLHTIWFDRLRGVLSLGS